MAAKLVRKLEFGRGVKGYAFEVTEDAACDRKIYDAGLEIEHSLRENRAQMKPLVLPKRSIRKKSS